ncbi:hypothetical protein [Pseudarthrobacter sp. NPDC058119]|uniref:hypothetical protein n=1 Tax=Pseudarthrobacter sp. NPDC058119 TaxID=3346348 RepID=UPI0036DC9D01
MALREPDAIGGQKTERSHGSRQGCRRYQGKEGRQEMITHRTAPHEFSKVAWNVASADRSHITLPDGKSSVPGVVILINGKVRCTITVDAARKLSKSLAEVLEEEEET